jgi:hypothetical protein
VKVSSGKSKVIIYFYNRLFDPVIQSNFWLYITEYLADPNSPYEFHLVTYEDERLPLDSSQLTLVHQWTSRGLGWTPLRWHPGSSLKCKIQDLMMGFLAVTRLRLQGFRHIVSLNSVAGAFAYLFSLVCGLKLWMYQYEPHSEYAVDNGIWRIESKQYKLAHFLERQAAYFATAISSGTRFMEERLTRDWGVKARFFKIPSVANSEKFQPDETIRARLREEWGITDRWVLLYPGKFGDLYYREEFAWMYRWLQKLEPRFYLLIVTPHSDEEVHALLAGAGVPRDSYRIEHSDYSQIQDFYFASDFGIISVPPGPSKKFISNIKVGEYLCAGLPYLIVRGVSEDYLYAEEKKVGVVVDDFSQSQIEAALPTISGYLAGDTTALRQHCRKVGLQYRGFQALQPVFDAALSYLVGQESG